MDRVVPQTASATESDAPAILDLQRRAYESEARTYEDRSIPPLVETLEELRSDMACCRFIKLENGGQIVGAVRARLRGTTVSIERLVVDPGQQGRGLGRQLLRAAETAFENAERAELFTGVKSERNLRLYLRNGYRPVREETLSSRVTLVFLEKALAMTPGRLGGRVSLTAAAEEDRNVLENLVQLYSYDWSEVMPLDVGADGRFAGMALAPYWLDDWRHPFLIRVDDNLVGFALIHERSRLTGEGGVFDMAEFFVMRRYRRQRVGVHAAFAAFDRFRGPWEVRQREENAAASAFWRRAIGAYKAGNYEEVRWNSPEWTGPVQIFSSK